jgi:hypothetical protein
MVEVEVCVIVAVDVEVVDPKKQLQALLMRAALEEHEAEMVSAGPSTWRLWNTVTVEAKAVVDVEAVSVMVLVMVFRSVWVDSASET